jgi:pimeloyl-ACP methyl ester carboxylesterase
MILKKKNVNLYYEVIDLTAPWVEDPETIVFCHGVAINCEIWAGWLPVLTPHFRIVRFDTRGFGRSHTQGQAHEWSMDLLADDILDVAGASNTTQFHLVGESMGGTACLQLACRSDVSLQSVSCVSTSHKGGLIQRVGGWREEVTRVGMAGWSETMMECRFFPGSLPEAQRRWFSNVQQQTSANSLLDAADLLIHTDLTDDLARIKVPTLLMAPDASPFVPIEIPAEIHNSIPYSELAVFPKTRHGLPFSSAETCAKTLISFLDRNFPDSVY